MIRNTNLKQDSSTFAVLEYSPVLAWTPLCCRAWQRGPAPSKLTSLCRMWHLY